MVAFSLSTIILWDHVFLLSAQEFKAKENLIIIICKSALLKIVTLIIPKYERYLEELQPAMIHVTVYSKAKIKSELTTSSYG